MSVLWTASVSALEARTENKNDDQTQPILYHPKFPQLVIPGRIHSSLHNTKGVIAVDAPIGHLTQSPILSVHINGKGPFYFMFDTGWSGAMISRRLVEKLKLPKLHTKQIQAITPNRVVDTFHEVYWIKELKIGGMVIENYAMDASSGFEDDVSLFRRAGLAQEAGLDGVLGINTFYGFKVTIDYPDEKLYFHGDSLSAQDKNVLPYGQVSPIPNIDLKINFSKLKRSEVQNFTVDTGSYSYIRVSACNIPEMKSFLGQETLMAYDFSGGETATFLAQLYGSIDILPDYSIQSPYIVFAASNCHLKPHGLLGRKFFEENLVTIDPDDALVKIERYRKGGRR